MRSPEELAPPLSGIPADGTTQAFVNVQLTDANGNNISGKTVTIAANGGSHATIATTSGVTNVNNGVALFTVTDDTPETVTISATDTTDGIAVTQKATVFVRNAAGGLLRNCRQPQHRTRRWEHR